MRAVAAGLTDVGRERDHNEDRFVLLPEFDVFVVADGMGGHQCGEVASQMATMSVASYFRRRHAKQTGEKHAEVLRASLVAANGKIHQRASASAEHRGMGTTVVAAALNRDESRWVVAHAGDSRCYRMRGMHLEQLTRDHSLVEEALRTRPDISPAELAYLPSNVITRALGVEPQVDVEITVADVELGDVFLLCSDGLTGFCPDADIARILLEEQTLTAACNALVAQANANGGGDNITAVLVRMEEKDDPWSISNSVPPPASRRASALLSRPAPISSMPPEDSHQPQASEPAAEEADDTADAKASEPAEADDVDEEGDTEAGVESDPPPSSGAGASGAAEDEPEEGGSDDDEADETADDDD